MVKSISSMQNTNLYSYKYKNQKCKNVSSYSNISFKAVNIKKASSLAALFSTAIAGISAFLNLKNKNNEFDEYFQQLSATPTYIYPEGKETLNPELKEYASRLDNLTEEQKKDFVKAFCKHTGFPKLRDVKRKMEDEILRVVNLSFDKGDVNPIFVGYSSSCSLGRATAIPGSDCDGLFIVTDRPYNGMQSGGFLVGSQINQRLLDTQGSHYPEVFSINELLPYIQLANGIFNRIKTPQKIENYKKNLLRNDQDFIKACEFNLDIAAEIKDDHQKDMLYLTAMFVEEYRAGRVLLNKLPKNVAKFIEDSAMYKYSNVVRQEGFKNNSKPKWDNRVKMASGFRSMSASQKFDICSEILKSTMGIKKEKANDCYEEFDMGNILESIDRLTSFRKYLEK